MKKDCKMKKYDQNTSASDSFSSVHSLLHVLGAKTHNLKNISVTVPHNKVTVFTGPSGSGKSSLAFDTIFVEGQRQYMDSLSSYTRRFLRHIIRPDVESITGIQPTIALEQRGSDHNLKSTVATVSDIYDFLRVLYSRVGVAHCYKCGRRIHRQTVEQIKDSICKLPLKTRFVLFAPIIKDKRGSHEETLLRLRNLGFTRARIDGSIVEISLDENQSNSMVSGIILDGAQKHTIEAVVDRLVLRDDEDFKARLLESLKIALRQGDGVVCCSYEKERVKTDRGTTRSVWQDNWFNTRYSCSKCGVSYLELEPRSFSFNSPYGACRTCLGAGKVNSFDPNLLIANSELALQDGAIALGRGLSALTQRKLKSFLERFKQNNPQASSTPFSSLDDQTKHLFFFGNPEDDGFNYPTEFALGRIIEEWDLEPKRLEIGDAVDYESDVDYSMNTQEIDEEDYKEAASDFVEDSCNNLFMHEFKDHIEWGATVSKRRNEQDGLIILLEKIYRETKSNRERECLDSFRRRVVCPDCKGSRIKKESRFVTIDDKSICEMMQMSVRDAIVWFNKLEFDEPQESIARPLIRQICRRLETMKRLKLDYLSLDRMTESLSGGELQRVRLTTALGNSLSGVCYILDEPTTGLHPKDVDCLLDVVFSLRNNGNTVLLVEHNEKVIRSSDWMIDFGPGAGVFGGEIMAEGTPDRITADGQSPTGLFLSGKKQIMVPVKRRKVSKTRTLLLEGVETNNLKNVSAVFPLGVFICVTGVSGSGKTSLINETLVPAVRKRLRSIPANENNKELKLKRIRGVRHISKLVVVDQAPLGRSPRSNPLTYSKVLFDEIRKLFASTIEAKRRGYKSGRFSFNIAGGRCEDCQGLGYHRIEATVLPDIYVPCPTCEGQRFNKATLSIKYQGMSISDILKMSFNEAKIFFENHVIIRRYIESFIQVGLGYLLLGQRADSLSGGEAQRVKLAVELANIETSDALYILDEPTSGLHPQDIEKLLDILTRLVESGNTVIVIEHSLDVMKVADWIIDLGPEGGEAGGRILACGSPEYIAELNNNETGRCLREVLSRNE